MFDQYTYNTWKAMQRRCTDPRDKDFHRYGGRGICVCDRWISFVIFVTDMGLRPQGMTLDRYPNGAGNYELGNCRWASPTQQARNRRDSRIVIYQGMEMTAAEALERSGSNIRLTALLRRLDRGWDIVNALAQPKMRTRYDVRGTTSGCS